MSKGKTTTTTTAPTEAEEQSAQVMIDRIAAETIKVPIVGTTPLLVHKFSTKAKRQMLDAMQGRKTPKQPKDPKADYESSIYRTADGAFAFPATAFKLATCGAARFYDKSVTMTALRQFMFFGGVPGEDGDLVVKIDGEPIMREDVVRVGQGTDLRYRAQFTEWSATLEVTYVLSALTRGSVLSLIDAGGMGVGVGEWRPEKKGTFGTYKIDTDRNVELVR